MTVNASGYPTAPLSTSVAAPASVTTAAEVASLSVYDNTEIDIFRISKGANSLMTTLIALGRQYAGGEYDDLSVISDMTNNYPEYKWKEQDDEALTFTVNAVLAAAGADANATVVTTSTTGLGAGTVLRNTTTNEQVVVVSVTNATDAVVARKAGGAAMAVGQTLQVIGSAVAGGISSVDSFGSAAVDKFNYIQKHIDTIIINDTDLMSAKVGGNKKAFIDREVSNTLINHKVKLEKSLLFGTRSAITTGSSPVYTMGGVIKHALNGYTTDISSTLTVAKLEEWLSAVSQYTDGSSTQKILLCGTKVRSALSGLWYQNQVRTTKLDKVDLSINSIVLSGGFEYILVDSPFMDENSGYDKHAVVIDPAYLKLVFPQGVDLAGNAFSGKTRSIMNTAETTHAKQVLDIVTHMSAKLANANAFGVAKIVA
jgi:hypothetical protein